VELFLGRYEFPLLRGPEKLLLGAAGFFGLITTLRDSPSPILSVKTAEWLAKAMWTMRLSYGGIGSKVKGMPLVLTFSAMRCASA
jgi:hypothetical protein